jgi:Zn-dependent membrane protease YugP
VNRIWKYSSLVDYGILLITATVNLLYLIVTLLVEFCAGPGKDMDSFVCTNVMNSSSVFLLYQSSE